MKALSHDTGKRCQGAPSQRGFGLMEVLVALVVFSIGLLGLLQLQVKSLAANNAAMSRSMATMFSYSIIDAMRIDKTNVGSYEGTVKAGSCPVAGTTIASGQLHLWCTSLGQNLGAADTTQGTIDCTGNTGGACIITVTYQEGNVDSGQTDTAGNKIVSTQTVVTEVLL